MLQINCKIVRNGLLLADVTYGDYASFEDAAAKISAEVCDLADADFGYFGQFNTKITDNDDYFFAWTCDYEYISEIVENNGFTIRQVTDNRNAKANSVSWNIISTTSNDLADVQKYLGMD